MQRDEQTARWRFADSQITQVHRVNFGFRHVAQMISSFASLLIARALRWVSGNSLTKTHAFGSPLNCRSTVDWVLTFVASKIGEPGR
jgi:hypothetical protein